MTLTGLRQRPRRLHEAVLDRDPVAAGENALLIVGIDAGVNEDRAATRVQQRPQFSGTRQIGHRFGAKPAGGCRLGEIDSGAGGAMTTNNSSPRRL